MCHSTLENKAMLNGKEHPSGKHSRFESSQLLWFLRERRKLIIFTFIGNT